MLRTLRRMTGLEHAYDQLPSKRPFPPSTTRWPVPIYHSAEEAELAWVATALNTRTV